MSALNAIKTLLSEVPETAKVTGEKLNEFKGMCKDAITKPFTRDQLEHIGVLSLAIMPVVGSAGVGATLLANSYAGTTTQAGLIAATLAAMTSCLYTTIRSLPPNKANKSPSKGRISNNDSPSPLMG
jgi:hypothetical protein